MTASKGRRYAAGRRVGPQGLSISTETLLGSETTCPEHAGSTTCPAIVRTVGPGGETTPAAVTPTEDLNAGATIVDPKLTGAPSMRME